MTSSVAVMVGLGMPPETAKGCGETLGLLQAGVGTASVGATLLSSTVNSLTTSSGQTAFRLPSHNAGKSLECYNTTATAALLFPPTGGTINGGSADASISLSQNKGVFMRYLSPLIVVTVTGA